MCQEMEEALQDFEERTRAELEIITKQTAFLEGQIQQVGAY